MALKQEFGRAELSKVAAQLSLTRCDVCGVAVERTEVCPRAEVAVMLTVQRERVLLHPCDTALQAHPPPDTPLQLSAHTWCAGLCADDLHLRPHI